MEDSIAMTKTTKALAGALAGTFLAVAALAQAPGVPPPGASPRIDAIKKAGVLRVGVLANAPWLVENTSGSGDTWSGPAWRSEEHTSELQSRENLVCRLLLEKKKKKNK